MAESKVFLVFNTACFGDVLLCNTLCQNIKRIYPNSKVVMIVNKPFLEAAKYQKDVDDVVVFDKNGEHKGIKGILKFIADFPYKKPFCSFITYTSWKNALIARLLGSKKVCILTDNSVKPVQKRTMELLVKITGEPLRNLPIRYIVQDEPPSKLGLSPGEKYIGLCTLSKRKEKDMPLKTAIELIKKLSQAGYKTIYLGAGDSAINYAQELEKAGCDFINLVNKTSIYEMACVLKTCRVLVSIDTGTMHLGCALDIPLVSVFYENKMTYYWAPDDRIYNVKVIKENQSADNIYAKLMELLNKDK